MINLKAIETSGSINSMFNFKLWLKKLIFSQDDSKSVDKKEKLVSTYLTIITLVAALKGIDSVDNLTLLVYGLFLLSIIFYYMDLGIGNNKVITFICGILASLAFSYILIVSLLPSLAWIFQMGYLILLWFVVGFSLVNRHCPKIVEY